MAKVKVVLYKIYINTIRFLWAMCKGVVAEVIVLTGGWVRGV